MKNKSTKKIILFKSILISNILIYILCECDRNYPILKDNQCVSTYCTEDQFKSGECVINEPLTKTQWLTEFIKFEKTNGDISLITDYDYHKRLLFSIESSDNKKNIYYGIMFNEIVESYYFKKNGEEIPYIEKNITEDNKMINPQLYILEPSYSLYIISIGIKNSNIEIFEIDNYEDNSIIFNSSLFFNDSRIIEGTEPLIFSNNFYLLYCTITKESNENTDYYLTLYNIKIERQFSNVKDFNPQLNSIIDIDLIKGNFASCIIVNSLKGHVSCLYLSTDNFYTITVVQNNTNSFVIRNRTIVGSPSNTNENNLYFLKAISIYKEDYKALYCYFSGDEDNVPTFLMRILNPTHFSLNYLYQDFPVIYLYDYAFNNNIKYNDITVISENRFYFVSTNNNKDILIIACVYIYEKSSYQLIIRYYTIKLVEYYYIQILNGIKIENFANSLVIAFDFCNYDLCQNSNDEIHNAGMFKLPHLDKAVESIVIDFVKYAFDYNRNYILFNILDENFRLNNNIFGQIISEVSIWDWNDEINYYNEEREPLDFDEEYSFSPEYTIIAELTDYSRKIENMFLDCGLTFGKPNIPSEFNKYCDKINETFGNKNEAESYEISNKKKLVTYYITIEEDLSTNCKDNNCSLCIEGDEEDYCLVCEDDDYTVLYGDEYDYGKLKLCVKPETETTIVKHELDSTFNIESSLPDDLTSTQAAETTIIKEEVLTEVGTTFNIESTNVGVETTNINIPSSTIVIETTTINTPLTDISIESTNIKQESKILSTLIISDNKKTQLITDELSLKDLIGNKYNGTNLSKEELKEIYYKIKDYINNYYNGENIKINTNNVKIQISNLDSQLESELSNVDLGKCAEILKEKYCKSDNDCLIMLKFDITPENEKSTYVQYEVYDQNSNKFIKLKECTGNNVIISAPIELDSYIEALYEMLSKSGYNLFDANDSFYNDICAAYTTENGTDILLYDRRMDIYKLTLNISLCQEGCNFLSYNSETKKAECDCPIQTNEINLDISDLIFDKNEMLDEFYETLKNSNFKVLKCYQLIYNAQVFIHNIGSIIMSVLLVLFFILMIIYFFKNKKKINSFIQSIIKNKYKHNENNEFNYSNSNKNFNLDYNNNLKEIKIELKENHIKKESSKKKIKKNKNKNKKKKQSQNASMPIKTQENNIYSINSRLRENEKNNSNKLNSFPPKKKIIKEYKQKNKKVQIIANNFPSKIKYNTNALSSISPSNNSVENNFINYNANAYLKENKKVKNNENEKKKEINIFNSNGYSAKQREPNDKKNLTELETIENLELNDQQMNSLKYEKALELDKRSYFQYYISLLKKKHLIFFTFIPTNDYNIMSLKISLFLVSFSLYLSVNAFFFSDETMHKIYEDRGIFNVIYQIPQILYSSVISSIINVLLKALSLSEKDILKIKEEENIKSIIEKSKKIEKCIKIKFVIFFFISSLLMLFFWYFISCFCAVYSNTQQILFKDTLISFAISMLYPFGLNLLPVIFRIPSLRAEKKDKKCLYNFSQLIALI